MASSFPTSYDPNHPNEKEVPLPNAPREAIPTSGNLHVEIELQPPLSRRGHGPGIVSFLAPEPPKGTAPAKTLDPEPVMKWAEEGYAVVGVRHGLKKEGEVVQALKLSLDALKAHETCSTKDKFAVFVYDPELIEAVTAAVSDATQLASICLLVSFCGPVPESCKTACVEHVYPIPGQMNMEDALACPVPDPNFNPLTETRCSYEYTTASRSPFSILPQYSDDVYDKGAAALAHTRTLTFLKQKIGGPWFDLERIWDQHTWYEFTGRSVAQTMGTMVAEPYVNHVPTMIGGTGRKDLTAFYRDHFIFANPPDTSLEVVSRTVGIDRIIDEFVFVCSHTTVFEWLLPGVPPTGRNLRIPCIAVVCIRGDRLYHEHIWWDQGTAMVQAGLLPEHVPWGQNQRLKLPVAGVATAEKLMSENKKCNEMFESGWGVSDMPK